jgi:hypothetical protein
MYDLSGAGWLSTNATTAEADCNSFLVLASTVCPLQLSSRYTCPKHFYSTQGGLDGD